MSLRAALLCFAFGLWPGLAVGQILDFPANATAVLEQAQDPGELTLALGPHDGSALPTQVQTGAASRAVWRIDAPGLTTLQIMERLQDQLLSQNWEVLYACHAPACGGFDFRFALDVADAPAMYVDLGDYRYLAARRAGAEGPEHLALLVSRSALLGFVQVDHIGPRAAQIATTGQPRLTAPVPAAEVGTIGEALERDGHVILADLAFETGSATLGEGPYASLAALAEYLNARPDRQVALVGHTDSEGSLDGNIALSRRRAGSVLERLATAYGVPRQQLDAQGMGYLSPVAPNLTEEGREANRRVEVILLSTD